MTTATDHLTTMTEDVAYCPDCDGSAEEGYVLYPGELGMECGCGKTMKVESVTSTMPKHGTKHCDECKRQLEAHEA